MIHSLLFHPADQPLFSLALHAAGCALDLRINDVPVFRDPSGAAIDFTLPVNEWVFRGRNEITLQAQALHPSGHFTAELQFRRLRQPLKHAIALAVIDSKTVEIRSTSASTRERTSDDSRAMPALASPGSAMEFDWAQPPASQREDGTWDISGSFTLPAPWPQCPWAQGTVLTDLANLKFSVRQVTDEFLGILARKKSSMMLRVAEQRVRDLEAVYHLGEGEVEEVLLFPRLLQMANWRVAAIPEEAWDVQIAANGRLARVINGNTGESALRLVNDTEGLEAIIEAWWAYAQRWMLVR